MEPFCSRFRSAMRLINVTTKTLEKFDDDTKPFPPYAILSHTWGPEQEEISFQELQGGQIKTGHGKYKFDQCCAQAARDGLSYAWIDTCCIDQTNSMDLGEAINSMFKWYKDATVCYAYLRDVDVDEDPLKPQSSFWKSRWFQRGWTLQELIVPAVVRFYDTSWNCLGQRRDPSPALVRITRIPRVFLLGIIPLHEASVAQRMSWAAGRVTKRKEDLAYCLLGMFGITMPVIYGEGSQAFIRLQKEIVRHINDDSILAWNFSKVSSTIKVPMEALSEGALASSPSSFVDSIHIVPSDPKSSPFGSLQTLCGGLLMRRRLYTDSFGQYFVVLQCHPDNQPGRVIGIPVLARSGGYDDYVRLHGHPSVLLPADIPLTVPGNIRILISHWDTNDDKMRYGFYIENALEKDLKLVRVIPHSSWNREKDILIPNEEARSGRLQRLWTMFRHQQDGSGDFILVLEHILQVSEPQVRHHIMTCDRGTDLVAVKRNFANIDWRDLNKHSASNGILSLTATVSRERVGKQDMFVVRLLPAREISDTYNVTNSLQRLKYEGEIASAWKRHHKLNLELRPLNALIEKKRHELNSTLKQSSELQGKIAQLQEEHRQLQQVEEAASVELAGLGPRHHELKGLRDALPEKAQTLQDRFDEQFVDVTVARSSKIFGEWTTADVTEEMLGRIPCEVREYYESVSEPMHTFLLAAARLGDEVPFRQFAKRGIDVNIATIDGINLIAVAALGGNKRIVQTLLILGADIERANKEGVSALHWACIHGHVDIVRLLLDHGANIEKRIVQEWTPLMLAVQNRQNDVMRVLIESGAETEKKDFEGWTALMIAAMKGQLDMVEQLLYVGADRRATDDRGRTPRDWARDSGYPAIIELFNILDTIDGQSDTATEIQSEGTTSPENPNGNSRPSRLTKICASLGRKRGISGEQGQRSRVSSFSMG